MTPLFRTGDRVVKNPARWTPNDFDAWGRGEGVGIVVEPPFELDDDSVDVRWPGGRCFEFIADLLPAPNGSAIEPIPAPVDSPAEFHAVWPLLLTDDLPRATRFYSELLGFRIVAQSSESGRVDWRRLVRGRTSIMLQAKPSVADRPVAKPAAASDVYLYFVCDDVDRFRAELQSRGLSSPPPVDAPYGMRQLELTDPDGRSICVESPIG